MKKIILTPLIMLLCLTLFAQDTLRTDAFDVIKDFKPTLTDIIKIASNPNPEIPEIKTPVLAYTLPGVKLDALPTIYTIKPLSMGTALLPKLKNNFMKLGYGNYNSSLVEAYISTTRNKKQQAGAYFKHNNSSPTSNNLRSLSNNEINLWAKKFVEKGVINAGVNYNRNVLHYYGFQPENLNLDKGDIRRNFNTFQLNTGYQNVVKDTSKLKYGINAQYYNFKDNNKTTENDFELSAAFYKSVKGNPVDVKVSIETNQIKTNTITLSRVFVDVNPSYTLNFNKRGYIKIGLNSTFFNDSNGTEFFPYINTEVAYQIIPKTTTIFAGLTGNYNRTTYRNLIEQNIFLSNLSLQNTNNKIEAYVGFRGEISGQTSYLVHFSTSRKQYMLFYGFDSITYGQATIYDSTTATVSNIKAELNHEFGDKFHLNFVLNYFSYNTGIAAPYSLPTFTTRTALFYNISNKIIIRGDIYTMNKRTAIELPSNTEHQLKGFVDVNLGFDYRYNKTIGLFLNFNNITNNKYQNWLNYPVFGFNVIGGLTVTF